MTGEQERKRMIIQAAQNRKSRTSIADRVPALIDSSHTPGTRVPIARSGRQIAGSIRAFGFLIPSRWVRGRIIAGDGRLAAARKLGLTEAPVVVLRVVGRTTPL